ncbi:DUF1178 family protein [Novosphingobium guangzhouense]|uniref:DUF1178 domain-containing protein n=1 Tax=Novosphingobium guangzhouense TaxID=1850347 RepID=A0A2K2G584_9SPHN|nr:DUF1178 family protein [Novosphingobium guangzhouense]PNU06194.1 hypothetical protein A8V01_12640 [Novosphingobium guangzhouense]
MIVYDLECHPAQHRFEGWFKSSSDFAQQQGRGLVTCPHCGSGEVNKAVQAPRLARKGNQLPEVKRPSEVKAAVADVPVANVPSPQQVVELVQALASMQAEALKTSRYVGEDFAKDARAMHYGERDAEVIHGQATATEAKELLEEGIELMPLPFPVIPPEKAN